jgi:hypothetical protein
VNTDQPSDRGPMHAYEISWVTGHVETIWAHSVSWPGNSRHLFSSVDVRTAERVAFHAEIDGTWTLILDARVEDVRTIRNKITEQYVEGEL